MLSNPARRTALIAAFAEAFEFDRSAGRMLLTSGSEDTGTVALPPVSQIGRGPQSAPGARTGGPGTDAHGTDRAVCL